MFVGLFVRSFVLFCFVLLYVACVFACLHACLLACLLARSFMCLLACLFVCLFVCGKREAAVADCSPRRGGGKWEAGGGRFNLPAFGSCRRPLIFILRVWRALGLACLEAGCRRCDYGFWRLGMDLKPRIVGSSVQSVDLSAWSAKVNNLSAWSVN